MTWFSSRNVTSFRSSTVALRSMRMTAPLMKKRSPALSVMFIAASLEPVADDLVDLDHRREVVGDSRPHAVDLLHHPDADRDDAGAQLVRQLVVGVVEVVEEDRPESAQIEERVDPFARRRSLVLRRPQHGYDAVHGVA